MCSYDTQTVDTRADAQTGCVDQYRVQARGLSVERGGIMYWTYRNHQPVRSFNTQVEAVKYARERQKQENLLAQYPGKWTVNYQGHDIPI